MRPIPARPAARPRPGRCWPRRASSWRAGGALLLALVVTYPHARRAMRRLAELGRRLARDWGGVAIARGVRPPRRRPSPGPTAGTSTTTSSTARPGCRHASRRWSRYARTHLRARLAVAFAHAVRRWPRRALPLALIAPARRRRSCAAGRPGPRWRWPGRAGLRGFRHRAGDAAAARAVEPGPAAAAGPGVLVAHAPGSAPGYTGPWSTPGTGGGLAGMGSGRWASSCFHLVASSSRGAASTRSSLR